MNKCNFVKWYVNVGKWKPTRDEWLSLTSSIDSGDEIRRINEFYFQEEPKSSLVGQALIRKFLSHATESPSNELVVTRSIHGRPEALRECQPKVDRGWPHVIDFNVSHSGNYCVLAGLWGKEECPNLTVGVDVTKIVKKKTKEELDRFLQLMSRREFLPSEWETVEKVDDDRQKCINFTRLWCLKESYIKSIGLGLKFKLNRICFQPADDLRYNITTGILMNMVKTDTRVVLDGEPALDWKFLETALDDEHLVAIGYNIKPQERIMAQNNCDFNLDESPFEELTIGSLVQGLLPIREPREENWTIFSMKSLKNV